MSVLLSKSHWLFIKLFHFVLYQYVQFLLVIFFSFFLQQV
jgi:hypothetical protein